MTISINDILECLEYENEYVSHYYNIKTGVIIYIENEETNNYKSEYIDIINQYEEYEQEIIRNLYDFEINREDYIKLPAINEEKIIEEFSKLNNIKFERGCSDIKKHIKESSLINEYYDYLKESEKAISIQWCLENKINFIN